MNPSLQILEYKSYVNLPHTPCDNFTCKHPGQDNNNDNNDDQYCKIDVTEMVLIRNKTNDNVYGPILISWSNVHDIESITPGNIQTKIISWSKTIGESNVTLTINIKPTPIAAINLDFISRLAIQQSFFEHNYDYDQIFLKSDSPINATVLVYWPFPDTDFTRIFPEDYQPTTISGVNYLQFDFSDSDFAEVSINIPIQKYIPGCKFKPRTERDLLFYLLIGLGIGVGIVAIILIVVVLYNQLRKRRSGNNFLILRESDNKIELNEMELNGDDDENF